eukprot:403366599
MQLRKHKTDKQPQIPVAPNIQHEESKHQSVSKKVKVQITQEKYYRVPVMVPVPIQNWKSYSSVNEIESQLQTRQFKSTIFLNTKELIYSSLTLLNFQQIKINLDDYFNSLNTTQEDVEDIIFYKVNDQLNNFVFKTMKIAGIDCVQLINNSDFQINVIALKGEASKNERCNCFFNSEKPHDQIACKIKSNKTILPGMKMFIYSNYTTLLKISEISKTHLYKLTFEDFSESLLIKILESFQNHNTCVDISQVYQFNIGKRQRELQEQEESFYYLEQRNIKRQKISQNLSKNNKEMKSESKQKLSDFISDQDYVNLDNPEEDTTCSICCDQLKEQSVTFLLGKLGKIKCCSHVFCFDCIYKWMTEKCNQCPLCRVQVNRIMRSSNLFQTTYNANSHMQWEYVQIQNKKQAISYQEAVQSIQEMRNDNEIDEDQQFLEEFFSPRDGRRQIPAFVQEGINSRRALFRGIMSDYDDDSDSERSVYVPRFSPSFSPEMDLSMIVSESSNLQERLISVQENYLQNTERMLNIMDGIRQQNNMIQFDLYRIAQEMPHLISRIQENLNHVQQRQVIVPDTQNQVENSFSNSDSSFSFDGEEEKDIEMTEDDIFIRPSESSTNSQQIPIPQNRESTQYQTHQNPQDDPVVVNLQESILEQQFKMLRSQEGHPSLLNPPPTNQPSSTSTITTNLDHSLFHRLMQRIDNHVLSTALGRSIPTDQMQDESFNLYEVPREVASINTKLQRVDQDKGQSELNQNTQQLQYSGRSRDHDPDYEEEKHNI